MAIMSLRQYARHRGVALSAVQKAIKSQRIATLPDGRIDPDAADAGWKRNTRAYAPAVTRRPEPEEDEGSPFGASQYTKARAVREHYQARLAKIDYEERVGKLVSRDEVTVAAFTKARTVRDNLLNIPDRVAAMLAAEDDPTEVHRILADEIRKALSELSGDNRG